MGAELGTQAGSCLPQATERSEEWECESALTSARSRGTAGRPTLIIFDWDDTLLCSAAVRKQEWTFEELQELESVAETTLRTAMDLGEVWIVTNGNRTWVQDSARRFMPGLVPLLSQLQVVSARALYEESYPNDPFMWKHAAFEYLLTKDRQFTEGVNLVALGDQYPEIDAARHITQVIGRGSVVKTLKLREAPSVSELQGQLRRIKEVLGNLAGGKESQDYHMVPRELPSFFDSLASSASGWQCVTEEELERNCIDPVKELKGLFNLVI